jgi:hypothetical protein
MMKICYHENEMNTANLYLKESRVSKHSMLIPSVVNITGRHEVERKRVEDFIKGIYKNYYGAEIQIDYPILMSVRNENNDILGAVGFRYAESDPLFLEQYIGRDIDAVLGCSRSDIAEIGNLASAGKGASIFLFSALSAYLHNKNIKYAALTGTDFLHKYFERVGLSPRKICDANHQSLINDDQDWGSYYAMNPRVLVGSVPMGVERLKMLLGAEFENCIPQLNSRLHYKG